MKSLGGWVLHHGISWPHEPCCLKVVLVEAFGPHVIADLDQMQVSRDADVLNASLPLLIWSRPHTTAFR